MTYTADELQEMVQLHERWVKVMPGGIRLNMSGQDLSHADMHGVNLYRAVFRSADLRDVNLHGAKLDYADFQKVDMRSANLGFAEMRKVNLTGANLEMSNMMNADLTQAFLVEANLRHVSLCDAKLDSADMRMVNLFGADLFGADLHRTNLRGTNLYTAILGLTKVLQLGPIGSRQDYLVVKQFKDETIEAMTGCFRGTLKELEKAVESTHDEDPQWLKQYRSAIAYCRTVWNIEEETES